MKSHYGEPSGDFTLKLTKDELHRLESTGRLRIRTPEIPCTASRLVWDSERKDFDIIDKRNINSSGLALLEYVGDLKRESHYIQYLYIAVEDAEHECDACKLRSFLPNYTLTHPDGRTFEGVSHFCPKCGRYMGMLPRYEGHC